MTFNVRKMSFDPDAFNYAYGGMYGDLNGMGPAELYPPADGPVGHPRMEASAGMGGGSTSPANTQQQPWSIIGQATMATHQPLSTARPVHHYQAPPHNLEFLQNFEFFQESDLGRDLGFPPSVQPLHGSPPPQSAQDQRPTPSESLKCTEQNCTRTHPFGTKTLLKRHLREVHNIGREEYPCPVKGCTHDPFHRRDQLKNHLRSCHKRSPADAAMHVETNHDNARPATYNKRK